ncbi:MAG: DUF1036 domain-containing protein [Actinobacteria bacterium]|nr:DUF1036 domain-containing protein [Actinomycetota bacterium]
MSHGRSEVGFTNLYGQKLFVAYMRRDFGCQSECGEPWDVRGWINLDPGETETRANPTKNQWFYYYAEAVDGSYWAGPYVAEVSSDRFNKCTCLGVVVSHGPQPYYDVGMRELDTVAFSGVNFVP